MHLALLFAEIASLTNPSTIDSGSFPVTLRRPEDSSFIVTSNGWPFADTFNVFGFVFDDASKENSDPAWTTDLAGGVILVNRGLSQAFFELPPLP